MADPDENLMLPKTPGPQLRKFRNGLYRKIEFLKGMGSGNHAHVWKTRIDGTIYALKMFRNIGAEEENAYTDARLKKFNVDKQLLDDQLSPFNCEARAYGRLKETGNEDLAWKCHGWIAMDEKTYSQSVWGKIGLPRYQWFSYAFTSDEQVADREMWPIYALVKEFIPAKKRDPPATPIDPAKAHQMAMNINTLHSIGITHRDIQDRNYVDCRFMDFSTSWTVPNVRLDRQLGWDNKSTIDQNETIDYMMFDAMWEKWNSEHPDKECNYRITMKETTRMVWRSQSQRTESDASSKAEEVIPMMERFIDNKSISLPSSYDWQKATHAGTPQPKTPLPTPPSSAVRKGVSDVGGAPTGDPADHHHHHHGVSGAGGPATPISTRGRYRGPDPRLPRFTMMWSWSAHPPAPRHAGLHAKKLKEMRKYAAEIIRDSKRFKSTAVDSLGSRAQKIIKIIDDSSGSSVDV